MVFRTSLAPNLLTDVRSHASSTRRPGCAILDLGVLSRGLVRWAGLCLCWLGCIGLARLHPRACPLLVAEPAARPPDSIPPAVCLGSPPACERATFTLIQEV